MQDNRTILRSRLDGVLQPIDRWMTNLDTIKAGGSVE